MAAGSLGKPVQINTRQPEGVRGAVDFAITVRELAGNVPMSMSSAVRVALEAWTTEELATNRQTALDRAPIEGMIARSGTTEAQENLGVMQNELRTLGFADVADAMNVDLVQPPSQAQAPKPGL